MINLNQYNWLSTDGKTVRPVLTYSDHRFETSALDWCFDCEGLEPGRVYKGEELREVWQEVLPSGLRRDCPEWYYKQYESFEHLKSTSRLHTRVCIKLKEQPKEEEPTTQEIRAVEIVEQAGWQSPYDNLFDLMSRDYGLTLTDSEMSDIAYACDPLRNFMLKRQLQNLPIKEILELVAERACITFHDGHTKQERPIKYFQSGSDHLKVDKQSILSLEEEILKLINNQK